MSDYVLCDHTELDDITAELGALTKVCFAEYDGVLEATDEFTEWYVKRPGMGDDSCFVALCGDEVVSSVFVTIQKVRIAQQLLDVGMIDTVMTHPAHRRHGLAKQVLTKAIGFMAGKRLDASILCTLPDKIPYHFYSRVGYRDHVRISFLGRENVGRSAEGGAVREVAVRGAKPDDRDAVIRLLNDHYADHDGYTPIDLPLWEWRRENRPPSLSAEVLVAERDGRMVGTMTVAPARLITGGKPELMVLITDVVLPRDGRAAEVLEALLSSAPNEGRRVFLSGVCNTEDNEIWQAAGFKGMLGDAAMALPLNDRGRQALSKPPTKWYVLTESVVGI